ncbi:Hypothetical protein PHPALM_10354 [Phytophthora palmivora]|uniref:RNA-directed DNA polymerase n=1 Tax=Phytophthora palmivora TaxID=4796 RepID=A0A2P4Y4Y9_9STRA|nr:Hypothetical protein PHPALM_10354 [Phytophthora palmivora]
MPGMGPDYDYDAEGDVMMAMPQPIFEVTRAPGLKVWSQSAITTFLRERRQYEDKVAEQCGATGEVEAAVARSVRSTIEPRVLEHVATYILKKKVSSVTDDMLLAEMRRKVGTMMNDRVPDVTQLFARELKMDLSEVDVEARIASYLMAFDRLIEDNGLTGMLGRDPVVGNDGRQRMKLRCKLLLSNVTPEMLKIDLTRLVDLTHRGAKADDLALHDLMVERATRQQQYHLMQAEMKQNAGPRPHEKPAISKVPQRQSKSQRPNKPQPRGSNVAGGTGGSATEGKKADVMRSLRERKERQAERVKRVTADDKPTFRNAVINGVLDVPFCPDTGSDANIIGRPVLDELLDLIPGLPTHRMEPPMTVVAAGGSTMTCHEKVHLDLQIVTGAGPLKLENIECLVLEAPEEELLLGRTTLQSIGVDLDDIFEQLAQQHIEEAEAQADDIPTDHVEVLGADDGEEITPLLHTLVDDAIGAGFDATLADDLRELVVSYSDIFRLRLGRDEPADVEPLDVRLVADAQPYRSGVRRYPEAQRQFLRNYVRELEAAGLVERNNNSRWSCPALPVAKQGTSEFRITIDYRPVNKLTVPLAGAAPNLSVVVESVRGAYGFGTFDFHKGFWQMPLHPRCREMFSFVTEDGVFTPTRVPQGASDSAVHFQAQMNEVLKDILFHSVLVWIDDVLLYATTPRAFLENLSKFFSILRQRNLKLNAKKCKLFARRVKWCGKVIDGEGVEHDPERLAALQKMPLPPTGAALQHFLCALNWLRDSMIDFARTVAPLQEKLEHVMRERGRRKSQLSGAKLSWSDADKLAFQQTLEMVKRSCKLIFPDKGATVCLFSDASLTGYSIVITQVRRWQDGAPVEDQSHELLICRGGLFKNAQLNWSIVEKEGYPIVKACNDLDYMLEREKGFHIYCDHSNLIQLFSPDREVKQHIKGKLQRWVLKMSPRRHSL